MDNPSRDDVVRELIDRLKKFERRLGQIEGQLTRIGDAAEFFVHRARRSDERLAEEFARQRMSRDPFSD